MTIVPHGGLEKLRPNIRLRSMVEKYTAHKHERAGSGKGSGGGRRKSKVPECEIHDGEKKHFYCVTCGVPVCRECLVLNHPKSEHDIQEIYQVVKERKANADMLLASVQRQVEHFKEDQVALEKATDQVDRDEEAELRKIEQRIQVIVRDVKAKGNALKLRVSREYQREREKLQRNTNNLEDKVAKLSEIQSSTLTKIVDAENDHAFLAEHRSIVDQLTTELDDGERAGRLDIDEQALFGHFHSGPSIPETRLLGQLTTKRKLQFLGNFGEGSCTKAQGIASMAPASFAIADSNIGRVSVYKRPENVGGQYQRLFCLGSSKVPAGKLINPCSIAMGVEGKFVVTDRSKPVVNIYQPSGHFDKAFSTVVSSDGSLPTSSDPQPNCVATAPNGMIVVGDNNRDVITVHSPKGDLLRTLRIRIKGINHIATNGREIAYTKTELDDYGRVFIVDFESGTAVKEIKVSLPTSICFDDRSGSLLVGRVNSSTASKVGNGSIEQYCLVTLEHIGRLAEGLFMPLAMAVAADGKLAVADCISVKVYKMV